MISFNDKKIRRMQLRHYKLLSLFRESKFSAFFFFKKEKSFILEKMKHERLRLNVQKNNGTKMLCPINKSRSILFFKGSASWE